VHTPSDRFSPRRADRGTRPAAARHDTRDDTGDVAAARRPGALQDLSQPPPLVRAGDPPAPVDIPVDVPVDASATSPVAVPSPQVSSRPAPAPLQPARDIGWLLILLSAVLALWGSWVLFPDDAVGMGAGYWVSAVATVSLLGTMWLRSTLPVAPAALVVGVAGGGMALLGAVRDYPTPVAAVMVAGGMGIAVGSVLQTGRTPDGSASA
jgi:hypothetical protein